MNILIPMDLTEVSVNALKYAYHLFPDAQLQCLHVSIGVLDQYQPAYLKQRLTEKNILKAELSSLITTAIEVEVMPDNISVIVDEGEIKKTVEKYASKITPDYIVMGSRDKHDLIDKWIGTISLGIIKALNFPVILVPRHASYNGFKKVVVATDHHIKNNKIILWLKEWNKNYRAFIKFLHIQDNKKSDIKDISRVLIYDLFEQSELEFGFEIENIKSEDVTSSLLAKAYNFHADLIITIPEKQSTLLTLLIKSISNELIIKSKVPILFYKKKH